MTPMPTSTGRVPLNLGNHPPPRNIKRYRCSYCDRAFSRSEHRTRHERTHTKERPFHCTKCPSTFVRRDLLQRHDRTVHALKPKPLAFQILPSSLKNESPLSTSAGIQKPVKLKPILPDLRNVGSHSNGSVAVSSASEHADSTATSNSSSIVTGASSSATDTVAGISAGSSSGEKSTSTSTSNSGPSSAAGAHTATQPESLSTTSTVDTPNTSPTPINSSTPNTRNLPFYPIDYTSLTALAKVATTSTNQLDEEMKENVLSASTSTAPATSNSGSIPTSLQHSSSVTSAAISTPVSATSAPLFQPLSADSSYPTQSNSQPRQSALLPLLRPRPEDSIPHKHTTSPIDHRATSPVNRLSMSFENDVEFNTAVLMTELHQSLSVKGPSPSNPRSEIKSTDPSPSNNYQSYTFAVQAPPSTPVPPTSPVHSKHQPVSYITTTIKSSSTPDRATVITTSTAIPQFPSSFNPSALFEQCNPVWDPRNNRPTRLQLNRYLSTYFTFFHPTLPFLHSRTFDPITVAPALLFGACSIGANLCHESSMAANLHISSKFLVSSVYEFGRDFSSNRGTPPLWAVQTLTLSLVFASCSGDSRASDFITAVRPALANLVTCALHESRVTSASQASHGGDNDHNGKLTKWHTWIELESIKRTYFAVFIVYGTLTATFNYPSSLSTAEIQPGTEFPCSESLWNASEHEWKEKIRANTASNSRFANALETLLSADKGPLSKAYPNLNPFSYRILSTALFVEIWQIRANRYLAISGPDLKDRLMRAVQSLESLVADCVVDKEYSYSHLISTMPMLAVVMAMTENSVAAQAPSSLISKMQSQHVLVVSGYLNAVVSQARLLLDLTAIQEVIRYHVAHDISGAAITCLTNLMMDHSGRGLRSDALLPLVFKCFDLYRLPCLVGIRMMKILQGSPALAAPMDSVMAWFELSLVLVMWCHRIEQDLGIFKASSDPSRSNPINSEESSLYNAIDKVCSEAAVERIHGRLAPALALLGADVMEANESWGIANVLSLALRHFGYSLVNSSNTSGVNGGSLANSTVSANAQGAQPVSMPSSSNNSFQVPSYSYSKPDGSAPQPFYQNQPISSLRTTAGVQHSTLSETKDEDMLGRQRIEDEMYLSYKTVIL